jgi:hypothetical protein
MATTAFIVIFPHYPILVLAKLSAIHVTVTITAVCFVDLFQAAVVGTSYDSLSLPILNSI